MSTISIPGMALVLLGSSGLYLLLRFPERRTLRPIGVALLAVSAAGAAMSIRAGPDSGRGAVISVVAQASVTAAFFVGVAGGIVAVTARDLRRALAGYTIVSLTTAGALLALFSWLAAACVAVGSGCAIAAAWFHLNGRLPRADEVDREGPAHEPFLACAAAGLIAGLLIAGLRGAG